MNSFELVKLRDPDLTRTSRTLEGLLKKNLISMGEAIPFHIEYRVHACTSHSLSLIIAQSRGHTYREIGR